MFKRTKKILIAVIISLTTTVTSYAAVNNSNVLIGESLHYTKLPICMTSISDENNSEITPLSNRAVVATIKPGGSAIIYPKLESYVGLFKSIDITTSSESESGIVYLYLYGPDNNLKSEDWMMGMNQSASWQFLLPSSGEWRLEIIVSDTITTAPVTVRAGWSN